MTTTSEGASENDSTRAAGDTARGTKQRPIARGGRTIGRLFRQVAKALAGGKTEDPQPKKKSGKQRGDHAARPFLKAASRLTRLPARRATTLPWNILDWLNLWQPGGMELTEDLSPGAPHDSLSPHL